MLRKNREFA